MKTQPIIKRTKIGHIDHGLLSHEGQVRANRTPPQPMYAGRYRATTQRRSVTSDISVTVTLISSVNSNGLRILR